MLCQIDHQMICAPTRNTDPTDPVGSPHTPAFVGVSKAAHPSAPNPMSPLWLTRLFGHPHIYSRVMPSSVDAASSRRTPNSWPVQQQQQQLTSTEDSGSQKKTRNLGRSSGRPTTLNPFYAVHLSLCLRSSPWRSYRELCRLRQSEREGSLLLGAPCYLLDITYPHMDTNGIRRFFK